MGLQDSLMTQVVAAHDVVNNKSRDDSNMAASFSKDRVSHLITGTRDLRVGEAHNPTSNGVNGNNDDNGEDYENYNDDAGLAPPEINGVGKIEDDVVNDDNDNEWGDTDGDEMYYDDDDDAESLTDEGRLSKALQSWMPDYVITPLPRQVSLAQPARQPLFSARLGREPAIKRASSSDSIETQLSLFSCSSHGSRVVQRKRRRRRKKTASADPNQKADQTEQQGSKWVELASRRGKGELDRFMLAQSTALLQNINLTGESEAFELCEKDEQQALFRCGHIDKLQFAAKLKKSDSMTNIKDPDLNIGKTPKQRIVSASAKKSYGKPVDFQELRKQMMNQRLAALSAHHRRSARKNLQRSHSRHSLTSAGSDVFLSVATPRTASPTPRSEDTKGDRGGEGGGRGQSEKSEQVSMWKGDGQILAIDLKRELTTKVKQRIATTTTALERVTGLGDDNEQRPYSCHLDEFPNYIDDDFAHMPKIPQRIRISPHLSHVIKTDIRVRMGRPRYHEIRVQDLDLWNRGQTLDRAHRNLKVFNWLHSLKEHEFDAATVRQTINDVPPDLDKVTFGEMVLIRAVDEPDVKPLYERKKTTQYIR